MFSIYGKINKYYYIMTRKYTHRATVYVNSPITGRIIAKGGKTDMSLRSKYKWWKQIVETGKGEIPKKYHRYTSVHVVKSCCK